jgi:hypothetical protein
MTPPSRNYFPARFPIFLAPALAFCSERLRNRSRLRAAMDRNGHVVSLGPYMQLVIFGIEVVDEALEVFPIDQAVDELVARTAWLDAAGESGLLGMAATARALAGSDKEFITRVDQYLYRGKGADYFDPGPLAREIAAWKREYPEIQLATFNYDQLLERALEDVGLIAQAREDNAAETPGEVYVRHLHGLLTGAPADDAVVLTERDYATWQAESWQDEFMKDALNGVCVFLGLSFTDQNLLRWIYGATASQHVAVLSRQSAPRLSKAVRRELESANRARLARANVNVYWADFYAEVAQLMHEARRRRGPGKPPTPYAQRAQKRALKGRRRCLPAAGLQARQLKIREILSGSLSGARGTLKRWCRRKQRRSGHRTLGPRLR